MKEAKTIIGFINDTLHGYNLVMGKEVTQERSHKIIAAIIGDMPVGAKCREVCAYCTKHYNFISGL